MPEDPEEIDAAEGTPEENLSEEEEEESVEPSEFV